MYLRTTPRKNKDGTVTQYYQLAHNECHPETGTSFVKILHSFGRANQLDRKALMRLCCSIARVCGVTLVDLLVNCHQGGLTKEIRILSTVAYINGT